MPSAITLHHIAKTYGSGRHRIPALKSIDLEVSPSEFLVLLGPSGCGKSTLLRILCGLEPASAGTVSFGAGLSPEDLGFVFQQFALLPWLTVAENVGLGLLARHVPVAERTHRVRRELERFHLERFANSSTHELSGGMQQRVGIARAFATDPKVICMDEPFSELDSATAAELRLELLETWHGRKPTIVMVTHLIPEAIELADRIAVLSARPGRIMTIIENDLPRPRDHRSPAAFALEDRLTELIASSEKTI